MKPTGIIRRIDELGRIVIPKEIRKNFRIHEGDSLEIYIDESENIILKKHSILKNIKDFAAILVDSIYTDVKKDIIIADTDTILAAAGPSKKKYINKELSQSMALAVSRREQMLERHTKNIEICDEEETMTYAISTIIVDGDAIGFIMIIDKEGTVSEVEEKIVNVVANFLAKHIAD